MLVVLAGCEEDVLTHLLACGRTYFLYHLFKYGGTFSADIADWTLEGIEQSYKTIKNYDVSIEALCYR
jgi:hypothetical protein